MHKSTIPALVIFLIALVGSASAQEQKPAAKPDDKPVPAAAEWPRVVAVEFYADWCQACKVLMPKITEVRSSFQNKYVLFTRFDLTDDITKEQASYLAAFAGLEEVYRRGNGRTGFVALIDAKTKKVIAVVGKDKSVDEIRTMIGEAIAKIGTEAGS